MIVIVESHENLKSSHQMFSIEHIRIVGLTTVNRELWWWSGRWTFRDATCDLLSSAAWPSSKLRREMRAKHLMRFQIRIVDGFLSEHDACVRLWSDETAQRLDQLSANLIIVDVLESFQRRAIPAISWIAQYCYVGMQASIWECKQL